MTASLMSCFRRRIHRNAEQSLPQYQPCQAHSKHQPLNPLNSQNPRTIIHLPTEIYLEILTWLPPEDQACLTLTCKATYIHFRHLLHTPELSFPSDLFHAERPFLQYAEIQNHPHTKVVGRLESPHWKYCPGCNKLHPRTAWKTPKIKSRSTSTSTYKSKSKSKSTLATQLQISNTTSPQYPPSTDCFSSQGPPRPFKPATKHSIYPCMPHAGIVDLCLCLCITFPQKLLLVDTLTRTREQDTSNTTRCAYYYDNLFERVMLHGNPRLWHICTVQTIPFGRVFVGTSVYLLGWYFKVVNVYVYDMSAIDDQDMPAELKPPVDRPSSRGQNTLFAGFAEYWMGADVVAWFARFRRFLNSSVLQGGEESGGSWGHERGIIGLGRARQGSEDNNRYYVCVVRNLGKEEKLDRYWKRCRRVQDEL